MTRRIQDNSLFAARHALQIARERLEIAQFILREREDHLRALLAGLTAAPVNAVHSQTPESPRHALD
jgi:hypothetical protein